MDLTDPDGVTPLLSALLNAHFDTAKYLLEAGAMVNKWDFWGRTPLYAAVDFNTLPHGGRPDRPSLDDTTPLAMIDILIAAGANPNLALLSGETPLMVASRGGYAEVAAQLLARGANVNAHGTRGQTAPVFEPEQRVPPPPDNFSNNDLRK